MKEEILTREELHNLIWSEPYSKIIMKYDISISYLKQKCRSMKIPIPPNGHWQRNKENRLNRPILSIDYSGENNTTLKLKIYDNIKSSCDESPLSIKLKDLKADKRLTFKVPNKLIDPDDLVNCAMKAFTQNKKENLRNSISL